MSGGRKRSSGGKPHGAGEASASVTRGRERLRGATEQIRETVLDGSPAPKPQHFDVGAVVICENADFRYRSWGDRASMNEYGLEIIRASLRLLVEANAAPSWLALPGGMLFGPLGVDGLAVEEEAEKVATSVLLRDSEVEGRLAKLTRAGLRGVLLGVDSIGDEREMSGEDYEVPVRLAWSKRGMHVCALARRCDWACYGVPPDAFLGSRYFSGAPSVYIAYCGEIQDTGIGGRLGSIRLGAGQRPEYVLDLSHLFRRPGMMKRRDYQVMSGIGRFVGRACANGSERLGAPVIISTVLVNRTPCTDPATDDRKAFWLAVQKKRGRHPQYLPPDRIVVGRSGDDGEIRMTINLFGPVRA